MNLAVNNGIWSVKTMKTNQFLKNIGMMAFVLAFSAGCASTQQEQQEPAAEAKKGPSACEKALASAEAARKKAASVGGEWRDIKKIMKKAKKAGGDKCVKLANKARRQAEIGYAQALAERAGSGTTSSSVYTVSKGDSLWSISGSSSVYGDPYQWPLIYKANRGQINDADLIFPGQALDIDRGASSADIAAAVNHAKTRGAWAIGVTEDSDKAYLAQ